MEKQETVKARVNDLIALCHIVDEFDVSKTNMMYVIAYNHEIIYKLANYLDNGKFHFRSKREEKFYQENSMLLSILSKYVDIGWFIVSNYDNEGKPKKDNHLEFFYDYMVENKEQINQILSLLERIKELGFEKLEFNENLNFTKVEYNANTVFGENCFLVYLENMVAIPNYESNVVKYRTIGSPYQIPLRCGEDEFSDYSRHIILNSLLFDTKRLPKEITKETIFDKIVSLKDEHKKECTVIKNSVNLSIGISDLQRQLNATSKTINGLEDVSSKDQLIELLSKVNENVEKLQALSVAYDASVTAQNPSITMEKLEKERQLYIERRNRPYIDVH